MKSPLRMALVATDRVLVRESARASLRSWWKKKVLFLTIGPPTVYPNSLRLYGGLGMPRGEEVVRLAAYALFRLNQRAEP